jgi:DNA-binding transcriptional regulator PaaX
VPWAARAELLLTELDRVTASLCRAGADGDAHRAGGLPEGFVALAAALQHLRRDPLLPPELLPTAWLGQPLREAYRACQAAYADAVGDFFAERGRSEAPSG